MEQTSQFGPTEPTAGVSIFGARDVQPNQQPVRQSGKDDVVRTGRSNRVLLLGRLRELALYRAEVLRHHGFQALTPETEEEAIEIIRQGAFDIAVLSYTLPDEVVQHFVELIRQHCSHCPVLAIAQTTNPDKRIQPDSVVLADKGPGELVAALRKFRYQ